MLRVGGVVLVVGVLVAGLVGCSGDAGSASEGGDPAYDYVLSPEEMEAEYWDTTDGLALPDGVEWPPVVHLTPEPDHNGVLRGHSYQPGYGTSVAYARWFCAWEREWLAQRGEDAERADAALEAIESFSGLPRYEEFYDSSVQESTEKNLAKAQLGDPSGISRDVELNCES